VNDAPLHAILRDVHLELDTPFKSKTLTITLGQIYSGSATAPKDDFPSFTACKIPEEFRVALLAWLTEP
jgi:hypothetical protein